MALRRFGPASDDLLDGASVTSGPIVFIDGWIQDFDGERFVAEVSSFVRRMSLSRRFSISLIFPGQGISRKNRSAPFYPSYVSAQFSC
jgi:hypothetical protein